MSSGHGVISLISERQDIGQFRKKHWSGSFEEYLDVVAADPRVVRNAFERVYDMVMSYGTETYEVAR
jgi:serine protein kinase